LLFCSPSLLQLLQLDVTVSAPVSATTPSYPGAFSPTQDTTAYRADFQRLRGLKVEIEHLQLLLEQSRTRLQKDFAAWCTAIQQQQQGGQGQVGPQQQLVQPAITGAGSRPATAGRSAGGSGQQPTPPTSSSSVQPSPQQARPPQQQQQQQQQRGQPPGGATRGAASLQPDPSSTLSSSSSGSISRITANLAAADLGSEPVQGPAPQQQHGQQPPQQQQQQQDWSHVDPAVLSAASPHLTGNPAADADIIRFYEARAKLLAKLGRA
jgi:kinesin family protein 6/9